MAVTPNSIVTPQTPRSNVAALSGANTIYGTSPSNTVLLVTAGLNGARLVKLQAIPTASVSPNQLQLFRSIDAGATKFFSDSALMTSYTMSQSTEIPTTDFGYSTENALILQANERIYVAQGQAANIVFVAEWEDY